MNIVIMLILAPSGNHVGTGSWYFTFCVNIIFGVNRLITHYCLVYSANV